MAEQTVLDFLSNQQTLVKASDIAKETGLTKKEVNGVLYRCCRESKCFKLQGISTPLWGTRETIQKFLDDNMKHLSVSQKEEDSGSEPVSPVSSISPTGV